jgi:hypothetical protein
MRRVSVVADSVGWCLVVRHPGQEKEVKLLQAYDQFARSVAVHPLFSPAYFELGTLS